MAERTLTQRELNRALLARQHLLRRATGTIPRVLQQLGGLQAQYAPAMYIGLWSRMEGLDRDAVTESLVRRRVIQGTLLRSTIHLVSRADYWPLALGVRQARREWYARVTKGQPGAAELDRAADTLRKSLMDGPVRQSDIDKLLGPGLRTGISLWLDMVRIPPSGTWERRRADLYRLAEHWIGPPTGTAEQGQELLVRRYLGGFGPASRAEIADWAGIPAADVARVLERLAPRRFRAEDGTVLFDLPRAPLPDPDTTAPVRFLPVWDATLLVHARRSLILPEQYRPRIFSTRTPHSFNTFLVDGAVAGTWRYEGGRIVTEEFAPLDAATRREVAEEGERLAAFHA